MKKNAIWFMLFSICAVTLFEPFVNVYANQINESKDTPAASTVEESTNLGSTLSSNMIPSASTTRTNNGQPESSTDSTSSAKQTTTPKENETSSRTEGITATFINGDTLFKQSSLNKNSIVPYPGAPELQEGQISFVGWFTAPVGGTQFDFKAPLQQSATFYAHFNQTYLIQFKNQQGTVIDSEDVKPGELIPKTKIDLTPPAGEHFSYWYVEGDTAQTPFNFDATKAEKHLVLVPKFSAERTVLFISEGSQIDPEYVNDGEAVPKPSDPTRAGYTFSHWSTENNGAEVYNFNQPITNDLTLFAVWTPKKVNYTIAYWMEKPNLSKDPGEDVSNYNFAWSTVKSDGEAGEKFSMNQTLADQIKNSDSQGTAALNYSAYAFSDTHTISGNGQTVINVYYKRTIYQVHFNLNRNDAEMTANGTTYTGADTDLYTISAKYGQDIHSLWPENPTVKSSNENFHGWFYPSDSTSSGNTTTGNPMTLTSNLISTTGKNDLTLKADYSTSAKKNVRKMYVESFNQTSEKFEDHYYDLFDTQLYYSSSGGYIEDPIYGYTFYKKQTEDSYNGSYYYLRNKHTLTYNTQGGDFRGQDQSTTKEYQETITAPKDPTRAGYTFAGWYLDSAYREKVDFDTFTMPDSNETFFAKWESNQNTVRYYDSLGGKLLLQQGYADNEQVAFPSSYVKGETYVEGKGIFNGWFWQVGQSSFEFSDTIPVTHDIDLYANWQTDSFHVSYDLGEGIGTAPIDEKDYDLTTKALVKDNSGITAPAGKVFIGWKSDQDNTIYYPEDHLQVRGETKLTAVYASAEEVVQINYHAGDYAGSPEDVSQKAIKQSNVTLKGAIFERPGKTLVGWSNTLNGSKDYDLSESGVAIEDSNMDLYAVWKNTQVNITFLPGDNGTLNYANQSITTPVDYGTPWKDAAINVPAPKADPGYKFSGWSPTLPSADEQLTKDAIFTAQFVKKVKGTVTVRYVDENGHKIADDLSLTKTEGDKYDVSGSNYQLQIDGYKLKILPNNAKGTFTDNNILVIFTYSKETPKQSGNVIVKYVDADGKTIHPDLELSGVIGSLYDVKGSNIMIEGYHFVKSTGNMNGIFSKDPIYITHVYKKNQAVQNNGKTNGVTHKRATSTIKHQPSSQSKKNKTSSTIQHRASNLLPKTGEDKNSGLLLSIIGFVLILGTFSIVLVKKQDRNK
ncbi:hypothetical protein IGI39_004574 [Enterococcus sp. AZ135]|uniref:InlB B-repeat-containing protein n=1 Tax=unclassified Enterococcus TaxID=2608891 RepID=UPI003F29B52A